MKSRLGFHTRVIFNKTQMYRKRPFAASSPSPSIPPIRPFLLLSPTPRLFPLSFSCRRLFPRAFALRQRSRVRSSLRYKTLQIVRRSLFGVSDETRPSRRTEREIGAGSFLLALLHRLLLADCAAKVTRGTKIILRGYEAEMLQLVKNSRTQKERTFLFLMLPL